MAHSWKNRGTYGQILSRKIKKLDGVLKELEKKELLTGRQLNKYMTISKIQDYSIQVQFTNIKRVEDFEILEKMEHDRGSNSEEISTAQAIENRIFS